MGNKAERYIVIPETVLHDKGLKSTAKLLYGEIASLTSKDGYCYATNDYFAKKYGCSKTSISRYVSSLEKKQFVKTELGATGRKIYIDPITEMSAPQNKNGYPPCQNEQSSVVNSGNHNNTVTIKIKKNNNRKNSKKAYGQYQNVFLSDEEMQKLQSEFPNDWENRIESVSGYCASSGKTYKNYLATIRNWARKEGDKNGYSVKTGLCRQARSIQSKAEDFEKVIRETEERRTAGTMGTMPVGEDSAGKSLRTTADRPWEQHKL